MTEGKTIVKAAKRSRVKHTSGTNDRAPHLAEAALCGKTAEVRKLVLAGAKVNAADQDGFTALMFAIMRGDEGMADYLIEQKADVNRRNKVGQTALMLAAQGGHKKLVEHLIRAGADVRAVDEEKRNAVSWAARRGDFPEVMWDPLESTCRHASLSIL